MIEPNALAAKFQRRFNEWPQIYRAPGRVNLIGDHTDYNDGFVLPAAIGFYCWAAISRRRDNTWVIFSENLSETVTVNADELPAARIGKWSDYPVGVIRELEKAGHRPGGASIYISSDVPIGAGLSSSAAIEVATARAVLGISGRDLDARSIAVLCQKAENDFVGTNCGIMDQFVSCQGRAQHALLLDCRSLEYRPIPIPKQLRLVVCNTMIKHELGSTTSQYNARRAECDEDVRRLADVLPKTQALRDVTVSDLEKHRDRLTPSMYKRCCHVISENARVLKMALALESNDLSSLSDLMAESHRSLREDYEVSCAELDLMVSLATKQNGVHGTRMTGAGFGGCTVSLVEAGYVNDFRKNVAAAYLAETGRTPEICVCEAADGAARVPVEGQHT